MAGDIAGQADPVAYDDAAPAKFPGFHRGDRPAVNPAPVPAAIHSDHERVHRILVGGPSPGTGPRALAWPDSHIVFVQPGVACRRAQFACSSICCHSVRKPGKVLATVEALRTRRPGTARPSTAAAITIR